MTPDSGGNSTMVANLAEVKKPNTARRYFQRDPKKAVATINMTRVMVKQPKFEGKKEELNGQLLMAGMEIGEFDPIAKLSHNATEHRYSRGHFWSRRRLTEGQDCAKRRRSCQHTHG
jgi:hypothetical protein